MTDEEREMVKDGLESIVTECLGGPGGDPDHCHKLAAAYAIVMQERLGFEVGDEDNREWLVKEGYIEEAERVI